MASETPMVYKRDGRLKPFDWTKIFRSIHKAAVSLQLDMNGEEEEAFEVFRSKVAEDIMGDAYNKLPEYYETREIQEKVVDFLKHSRWKDISSAMVDYRRMRDFHRHESDTAWKHVKNKLNDLLEKQTDEQNIAEIVSILDFMG